MKGNSCSEIKEGISLKSAVMAFRAVVLSRRGSIMSKENRAEEVVEKEERMEKEIISAKGDEWPG